MTKKPKINKKKLLIDFLIPCLILGVLTYIFRHTNLDIWLQKQFFISPGPGFNREAMPWYFFYEYGTLPPVIFFIIICVVFVFGLFMKRIVIGLDFIKFKRFDLQIGLKRYRKAAFFAVLLMILGPGIVVNAVFKNNWGRPRPQDCKVFNGEYSYTKVWDMGKDAGINGSFPAGHPSVGFFLFFLFFIYKKTKKKRAYAFLLLALIYGGILGLTRMIQGGHFASDVIWCGGFIYLIGLIQYYCFRYDVPPQLETKEI
jgi:lipid A 4'-phosphatase